MLFHISSLEPPFTGDNLITLGFNIVHKQPKNIPSQYSPKLNNFINKLLDKNPQTRPTAQELIEKFPMKMPAVPMQQQQPPPQLPAATGSQSKARPTNLSEQSQGKIELGEKFQNLIDTDGSKEHSSPKESTKEQRQRPVTSYQRDQKMKNDYNNSEIKVKDNMVYDIINKNELDLVKPKETRASKEFPPFSLNPVGGVSGGGLPHESRYGGQKASGAESFENGGSRSLRDLRSQGGSLLFQKKAFREDLPQTEVSGYQAKERDSAAGGAANNPNSVNASVSSASPARIAVASPHVTCTVG